MLESVPATDDWERVLMNWMEGRFQWGLRHCFGRRRFLKEGQLTFITRSATEKATSQVFESEFLVFRLEYG